VRDGIFILDATVHAFNFREDNYLQPFVVDVTRQLYHFSYDQLHPVADPRYRLTYEQVQHHFDLQPDLMARVMFAESQTDAVVYHGVPMYGLYGDGSSPLWVAERLRERLPHRVHIYGDVSPWQPDAVERIDHLADEVGVIGLKFYPADMIDGRVHEFRLDDEQVTWPLIEHARSRGIKVIAVHKAVPLGPLPIGAYKVDDVAHAAESFPDVTFEIVHGGAAFAHETAEVFGRHDNVVINLESLPCFAVNLADRLEEMIGPLVATGRTDAMYFATGAVGMHPQPTIEAFARFRMPGLDDGAVADMFGRNFARLHGIDVDATLAACASDEFGVGRDLAPPWSTVPTGPVESWATARPGT
jgi:hypothetical protein